MTAAPLLTASDCVFVCLWVCVCVYVCGFCMLARRVHHSLQMDVPVADNLAALEARKRQAGFTSVPVAMDGNCAFTSVLVWLSHLEQSELEAIRDDAVFTLSLQPADSPLAPAYRDHPDGRITNTVVRVCNSLLHARLAGSPAAAGARGAQLHAEIVALLRRLVVDAIRANLDHVVPLVSTHGTVGAAELQLHSASHSVRAHIGGTDDAVEQVW